MDCGCVSLVLQPLLFPFPKGLPHLVCFSSKMPYLEFLMASLLADQNTNPMKDKVVRNLPSTNCSMTYKEPHIEPADKFKSRYKMDLDERKILYMRNILKAEVSDCFVSS